MLYINPLLCAMPVIPSLYAPRFYFRNGHVATLVPSLFRKVPEVRYDRERIATDDDDFLDLDWSCQGNGKLIILSHGLEGSSDRSYILGMVRYFNAAGWDALAWNCRSCSGEMNKLPRFYHHADTADLRQVIDFVLENKQYEEVLLAGFSMGGSMTLNYLGEYGEDVPEKIKGAAVFSVPLNLRSSVDALARRENRMYRNRFLRKLEAKIREKEKLFPDRISSEDWNQIAHFPDFDNRYTAPLHGFRDAEEFYESASALNKLDLIRRPVLLVNAVNDPFLGPECYPFKDCENLDQVYFEAPAYGGHVGFPMPGGLSYMEVRSLWFYREIIDKKP